MPDVKQQDRTCDEIDVDWYFHGRGRATKARPTLIVSVNCLISILLREHAVLDPADVPYIVMALCDMAESTTVGGDRGALDAARQICQAAIDAVESIDGEADDDEAGEDEEGPT